MDADKKKELAIRCCFDWPVFCLVPAIFIVGCIIASLLADEDMQFFRAHWHHLSLECIVVLAPTTLKGETIQIGKLEFGPSTGTMSNGTYDRSTELSQLQAEWDIEQPPAKIEPRGLERFQSESCNLILDFDSNISLDYEPFVGTKEDENGRYAKLAVFRKGDEPGIPPLKFDHCPVQIETRTDEQRAAYARIHREWSGFDVSAVSQLILSIIMLCCWLVLKVVGLLRGYIAGVKEYLGQAAQNPIIEWFAFSLIPSCFLAPWTSMKIHDDCAQLLKMTAHQMMFAEMLLGILLVLSLFICSENLRKMCFLFTAFMAFLIPMWDWFEAIFEMRLPTVPFSFNFNFSFKWTDYTLGWTLDWFHLMAVLILCLETSGSIIKTVLLKALGLPKKTSAPN